MARDRRATKTGGNDRSENRSRRPRQRSGSRSGSRSRPRQKPRDDDSHEPIITKITPFGLFAYQEDKLLKRILWGKDPSKCAFNYFEKDEEIKKFNNTMAIKARRVTEGVFGEELKKVAIENGFRADEFSKFFQTFSIELTKLKLKFGFSEDKLIIQAINNFDEITRMINIFYERLSEWYGFYYPEAVKRVEHMEDFAEIVGKKRTEKSMGYDLANEDLKTIGISGHEMKSLVIYKKRLEAYIEQKMNVLTPNLEKVAGPILGAKLIAGAGSIKKLAAFPSSTVQLLGAEKSLFRHIRKGAKPPKYGYILQHKVMSEIPVKHRGKFARFLSGKINIAVKVDYYSKGKEKIWDTLVNDIEAKVKKLKSQK